MGQNQHCSQTSRDPNTPIDFYLRLGSYGSQNTINWIVQLPTTTARDCKFAHNPNLVLETHFQDVGYFVPCGMIFISVFVDDFFFHLGQNSTSPEGASESWSDIFNMVPGNFFCSKCREMTNSVSLL